MSIKMSITAFAVFFCFMNFSVYAGSEFEYADPLPDIGNIVFSETAVGFLPLNKKASDQRHFILSRESGSFREVDTEAFFKAFSESKISLPLEGKKNKKLGRFTLFHATDGTLLKEKSGYCGEGLSKHHQIWFNGEKFPARIKPCNSIGAIEIVEKQLWLGTVYHGEGGNSPAEGIIIHNLADHQFIKKIDKNTGLTSNLIRAIRLDPFKNQIWVISHLGINRLNADFNIVNSWFFYEDFDSKTGVPTTYLSSKQRDYNPFAIVSRRLKVEDSLAFYQAVQQIPEKIRESFHLYYFYMYSSHYLNPFRQFNKTNQAYSSKPFAPKAVKILMPFFIRSAQSSDYSVKGIALQNLCMFRDKKVADFLLDQIKFTHLKRYHAHYIQDCLKKYVKIGLISHDEIRSREKSRLN